MKSLRDRQTDMRRVAAAVALVALTPAIAALRAQTSPEAESEAKNLVVMLTCRLGSDSSQGAGIIVGADAKKLYIMTADHVVRPCRQSAGEVRVAMRWQPQSRIVARLMPEADTLLDVAVVVVDDPRAAADHSTEIPFDRLGYPDSLVRAKRVFSIGYSRGRMWAMNTSFDVFAEAQGTSLFYESNFIGPGMSGGGLFDEELLLVGMIRSDQPPTGEAVSMTRLLQLFRRWRYPVNLRVQSVPSTLESVVVGWEHMCALDQAGAAFCWGGNAVGMLGTGTRGSRSRRVIGNLTFRSLTAGQMHTCGLTKDQAAYCWGFNMSGSLGTGTTDGIGPMSPVRIGGDLRFASITAGSDHSCGVSVEGIAYCWGDNESGELGDGSKGDRPVPTRVSGNLRFSELSPADNFTCGITTAGSAYCWGLNFSNRFGGDSTRGVSLKPVAVRGSLRFASIRSSGASQHTCGLTSEGAAYCWGWNKRGQLGNGATYDDSVQAPTPVAGNIRFKSLTLGAEHTCGVAMDGRAFCWGRNEEGQLGTGNTDDASRPTPVVGELRWSSLAARVPLTFQESMTCGLTIARALFCWGTTKAPGEVDRSFPLSRPVTKPREVRP